MPGSLMKRIDSYAVLNAVMIVGVLVSLFLVYEHFVPSASKYCSFGEDFDCGIVNKSPYATLDGISYLLTIDLKLPLPIIDIAGLNPVFELLLSNAFLGASTLVFLLLLMRAHRRKQDFLWIKKDRSLVWAKGVIIFSVLYGFYLFLVQHFILMTYCLFCLSLDLVLVISLIIIWRIKK